MTLATLVVRYAAFAVIATVANLGTQAWLLHHDRSHLGYAAAVGAGTIVGLVIKYLLDKRWIFFDAGSGLKTHGRHFVLYAAMSIVTTAIFWGSETAFWLIWKSDRLRELGAVLGLGVGYVVKYNLDRRFVFTSAVLQPRPAG